MLRTLSLCWLAATTRAASANELTDSHFGEDDECLTDKQSACAVNALQHRSHRTTNTAVPNLTAEEEPCGDCMLGNAPGAEPELGASHIWHYSLDCWRSCGGKAGFCPYCGPGNACCRYFSASDPPECKGVTFWPVLSWHTCVQPRAAAPAPGPVHSGTTGIVGNGYQPVNHALALPSEAPVLSFYMYRAVSDSNYPPENVNTANLAGIMWYLHNEVVVETPRKFGIKRIVRLKVQLKAPQPLFEQKMNFGVRYAFDSGRCTGPWDCGKQFDNYGYFVGCNYVDQFPTDQWSNTNRYPNAIWYSLPGPCSSRTYNLHDDVCVNTQPGGSCSGTPTGRGNCTYSAEVDGEITVDELEGLTNYQMFITLGGKEFVRHMDKGVGMDFWNGKLDPDKCSQRVEAAEKLFEAKYGPPQLPEAPKCDFDKHTFFQKSPP